MSKRQKNGQRQGTQGQGGLVVLQPLREAQVQGAELTSVMTVWPARSGSRVSRRAQAAGQLWPSRWMVRNAN